MSTWTWGIANQKVVSRRNAMTSIRWQMTYLSSSPFLSACFSGLSFVWHITNSIPSLSCVSERVKWKEERKIKRPSSFLVNVTIASSSFSFRNLIMRWQWNEWPAVHRERKKRNDETPVLHCTTDVRLFHFSDKPTASFVCACSFSSRFFNGVTHRHWWELVMISYCSSITCGHK